MVKSRHTDLERSSAALACVVAFALACGATIQGDIPPRSAPKHTATGFQVGASRVDITPIPGIPLAGYSIMSKISRGFWTRLYARAIYVEDAATESIVLVSTDLMIIPNGLGDRVADLVAADPDLEHLGREQIILAATETHQGPGNYFSSKMYNGFSSARPGFDEDLFDFLAAKITLAVKEAFAARKPAVLKINDPADDDELDGFFRNRAFRAFLLNPEAKDYLEDNDNLSLCTEEDADYPDDRACRAVHPHVEFLSFVDAADTDKTIAMAVFLAAHSTILPPSVEVYSGDLFAVTAALLEPLPDGTGSCAKVTGEGAVVALFNGAQGDVSVTWKERDRGELLARAQTLANKVCTLLPGVADPDPTVAFQYTVVDPIGGQEFFDASQRAKEYERKSVEDPKPGVAELGGAPDGRTIFYDLGLREEMRSFARDEHGAKLPPGKLEVGDLSFDIAKLTFILEPPPDEAPLGVYRLGKTAIVALPGEFTTIMGQRVREAVTAKLGPPDTDRVLLIGFGNGHVSYLTTPEEYDAQYYEGASNYYGAETAPLLTARLGELAEKLETGSAPPKARPYHYEAGSKRSFKSRDAWGPPYWVDDGLSEIVQDPTTHFPKRDFPFFCWIDALPVLDTEGTNCERVVPGVKVVEAATGATAKDGDEVPQNNRGLDLVTVAVGVGKKRMEWCAIWMVPDSVDHNQKYRFEVDKIIGSAASQDFEIGEPEAWSPRPSESPLEPDRRSDFWCRWGLPGTCPTTCSSGS